MNLAPPKLEPCPHCARLPKLHEKFFYGGFSQDSLYSLKYECRRWFGLRLCFGGAYRPWFIAKGWYDVGLREAAREWNEAVDAAKKAAFVAAGGSP